MAVNGIVDPEVYLIIMENFLENQGREFPPPGYWNEPKDPMTAYK